MGTPALARTRIYVQMDDGAEFVADAVNVDLVAWDRERARRGWPLAQDAPFVWLNYLAWHNLTKTTGVLPAMTLAEFETRARHVVSNPDEDDDTVDPTPMEPEPG